jgi:hypothetical protein
LPFSFPESDTSLPLFVCRVAASKNNELHSDPLFPEGKQMASNFLKSNTVAEAADFFFFHVITRNYSNSI